MKIVTVGYGIPGSLIVPDGCSAVLAFTATGNTVDLIGTDQLHRKIGAILSPDPNVNFSQTLNGTGVKLFAIANENFPKIPVSAGERLLVAFEDAGTAIVYFDSAE